MRGILKQKKTGHTGTLDPGATGVFPVCLGQGTKLCGMLTGKTKTYQAVIPLSRETDTQDTTGELSAECAVEVTPGQVEEVVMGFVGDHTQIPPMYSVLKVNGKKLYELARADKEVEREARPVAIYSIAIDEIALPRATMTVNCSKGTYIRTLCHDIGRPFCCGGCMEKLLRTQVDRPLLKGSLTLAQIEVLRDEGRLSEVIVPVDGMFAAYPVVRTRPGADYLVHNGNQVKRELLQLDMLELDTQSGGQWEQTFEPRPAGARTEQEGDDSSLVRIYDSEEQFIGAYEFQPEKGWYKL